MIMREKSFKYTRVKQAPTGAMLIRVHMIPQKISPLKPKDKVFKNRSVMMKCLLSKPDRSNRNAFN